MLKSSTNKFADMGISIVSTMSLITNKKIVTANKDRWGSRCLGWKYLKDD